MNGITHKQAQKYLRLDLDGLLTDDQRRDLETHLSGCEACRVEAQAFSTLTSRLQSGFRSRWDAQDGPSNNVMATVRSQTWRIIMSNRINVGVRALAGFAVLLVLGFGLNFVISQIQKRSVVTSPTTEPANLLMPVIAPNAEKRMLAFTMEKNGNTDVYTVRADGSDLINLTKDSSGDNPYWSPDGKRIAFNRNEQVFIMDADGSNAIQLTDGGFNKLVAFEEGRESGFDAWSPDGKKLVFVKGNNSQAEADDGKLMKLYILDVETKTQTPLTSEWGLYQSPVWSPDGEHVAFISITTNGQGEPTQMSVQIVGLDGNNLVSSTEFLLEDEFSFFNYWSGDGQSVFFSIYKKSNETYIAYEAGLDGSLIKRSEANRVQLLDWWNETTLTMVSKGSTLNWLRPDGTLSTLDACPNGNPARNIASRRSNSANLFLGVQCSFGEWHLYLANEDGRVVQELLDPPLSSGIGSMIDQAWSPDDNFIAFNISSQSGPVEMHILDVARTLEDPSTQPVRINVGDIFSSVDSLSWQPVLTEEVVEQDTAPEPTQTTAAISPDKRLLAFASAVENGNLDIYTMYPDGSGLTNLTNDPAHDVNPYWSPDGKHITFMSDRAGFMQIFVMNADGSNLTQVTNDEADHEFGFSDYGPWSPDGSKLLFTEWAASYEKWMLYTVGVEGENKTPIAEVPNIYTYPSWSPDENILLLFNLNRRMDFKSVNWLAFMSWISMVKI